MTHDNHSPIQSCSLTLILTVVVVKLILAELHHGARNLDILVVEGHEDVPKEGVTLPGDNSVDLLRSLKTGAALLE